MKVKVGLTTMLQLLRCPFPFLVWKFLLLLLITPWKRWPSLVWHWWFPGTIKIMKRPKFGEALWFLVWRGREGSSILDRSFPTTSPLFNSQESSFYKKLLILRLSLSWCHFQEVYESFLVFYYTNIFCRGLPDVIVLLVNRKFKRKHCERNI